MKHIIIGAGPAAVIAAETLRKVAPTSSIAIIGDEPERPYSRMALPYYLTNRIDEAGTYLRRGADHFSNKGIDLIVDRVEKVNVAARSLSLANNKDMAYDKLLIATGSHPLKPPIEGIDLPGVHSCWDLKDARNIIKKAQAGANVVLMGAGFIGCIVLEALSSRKVNLTVIEMDDRMVPRMMDQVAGNLLKDWCLQKGVMVQTGRQAKAITSDSDGTLKLHLDNGETLNADLIISATGVAANTAFLAGSGIETDHGVLVNDHLQSNQPDIYAAGDVCQGKDFSTGQYTIQAIQPTAADHGRIAAMNMAGKKATHQGCVVMNVLDTIGLISSSYGLWMGVDGGDEAMLCDPKKFRYLNLQFQDDVLIGAQSLGLTQHIGVLRGLIQTRLKLGKWKQRLLKDPTRIMEAYLANTQAIGYNAGII